MTSDFNPASAIRLPRGGILLFVCLQKLAIPFMTCCAQAPSHGNLGVLRQNASRNPTEARTVPAAPIFLRLRSGARFRGWRQGFPQDAPEPWSITSWTESVCVLAAVSSVKPPHLVVEFFRCGCAPLPAPPPPWRCPEPRPENGRTPRATGKADSPATSDDPVHATRSTEKSLRASCAPCPRRADLHRPSSPARSKQQITLSRTAVSQCDEANRRAPLRST